MGIFNKLIGENDKEKPANTKQEKANLEITGMTCDHCATGIEKLFDGKKGIIDKNVSYENGKGEFTYDACCITKDDIINTINGTKNYRVVGDATLTGDQPIGVATIEATQKTDLPAEASVQAGTGPVITPITEKTKLKPGDKIKVRIELRVDRSMEYVHMKDMRASGFEPINVISHYKYQGGLGYYESTRDAATNFFFSYLPKGTYVFEYPLRVTHKGNFSNGITTIQCMYAPEFASHSEGIRVSIGK